MNIYKNFDTKMMIGQGKEFAEDLVGVFKEFPVQWVYFSWLTCFGSMISDKVVLANLETRPNLFTFLMGSSSSRKSTVGQKVIDGFRQIPGFNICHGVGSEIGLGRQLNRKKNMLLFQDEIRQLYSKASISSSCLLSSCNTLFEKTEYENEVGKASNSMVVSAGYLSILGCSTPETYQEMTTQAVRDMGFDNRVFLVPGSSKRIGIPEKDGYRIFDKNEAVINDIMTMIENIMEKNRHGKKLIRFDPDVYRGIYLPFYRNEIETLGDDNNIKRLESYTIKLAILLALSQQKVVIDEITLNKAIDTIRWEAKVRDQCNPTPFKNDVADYENRISKYMRQNRGSAVFVSKLKHVNRYKIQQTGSGPFLRALENLTDTETIQPVNETSSGVAKSYVYCE